MSGEMINFRAGDAEAGGYLALPEEMGPAVMVIQEWWGLAPQIKAVCDRLASEGFVALAPDLYHGELAQHSEMDKAGELMSTLPPDRAARDMSGAVDYLLDRSDVEGSSVGVVGFCMGGMLTLLIAASEGERIAAAAPFYGAPLGDNEPDWSGLTARVEGHFASVDDFFPPDLVIELEKKLKEMGKEVAFNIYPQTGHAFANEENPLGTYNKEVAEMAWSRVIKMFERELIGT
ncbi:MAG: hydrolase [Actinobacteria bacterium]|nr:hydrolase [Actinomycetota bacterium]